MSEARFLVGDVFDRMAKLPDGSVDLIVTSPPFLALRSYLPADHPDKALEIGSESTPAAFLSTLLALTRECRRLLAPHGSLCVELGDTYAGSGGAGGDYGEGGLRDGQERFDGSKSRRLIQDGGLRASANKRGVRGQTASWERGGGLGWPLDKSLCLLPTLYPASLAYGRNLLAPDDQLDPWRIRNLIVWHRPNPPVGALGDKVRPSTSYVTVACTSRTRWFDLDAERTAHKRADNNRMNTVCHDTGARSDDGQVFYNNGNEAGAPPLDCWTIPTAPFSGAHYATFPPALPRKLINLMCPRQVCVICGEPRRRIVEKTDEYAAFRESRTLANIRPTEQQIKRNESYGVTTSMDQRDDSGSRGEKYVTLGWTDCGHNQYRRGVVLDPFAGSGTSLMAASELGRDSIGIDLDSRNLDLARARLGMFLVEEDEVVA